MSTEENMSNLRSHRRQVLKGAGALAATAALLSPTTALAKTTSASQAIVGSWLFTVNVTGGPQNGMPIKSLVSFGQGGTLIETEQGDISPSTFVTSGQGAWVKTGSDDFAMTFIKIAYDPSGNLVGTAKNHGTLQVDGDTLTAKGTFVATDPSGKVLFTGSYTATATRIRVER